MKENIEKNMFIKLKMSTENFHYRSFSDVLSVSLKNGVAFVENEEYSNINLKR